MPPVPLPPTPVRKVKIFDPADGFGPVKNLVELSDATLARRGDRWWMYLSGQHHGANEITLFSASLPEGSPLGTAGWAVTALADDPSRAEPLGGMPVRAGGRHCPSYVKGSDPAKGVEVERIYYARDPGRPWGPYSIAYLEWDGSGWVDQATPAFLPTQEWEKGSVYEPNLVYSNGKWRMWYVAGSNRADYLVHGYSESIDGRTDWSPPRIFATEDMKLFDFRVYPGREGYGAVFSRVWVGKGAPPVSTGLWWCHAPEPYGELSRWSEPIQIMDATPSDWHHGPWKPSVHPGEASADQLFIFFDGIYRNGSPGPFPFAFTQGCLECSTAQPAP